MAWNNHGNQIYRWYRSIEIESDLQGKVLQRTEVVTSENTYYEQRRLEYDTKLNKKETDERIVRDDTIKKIDRGSIKLYIRLGSRYSFREKGRWLQK